MVVGAIIIENKPEKLNEIPEHSEKILEKKITRHSKTADNETLSPKFKNIIQDKSNDLPDKIEFPPLGEHYQTHLNLKLGISCAKFVDIMWDPSDQIFKNILELEEIFEYDWGKFGPKSTIFIKNSENCRENCSKFFY